VRLRHALHRRRENAVAAKNALLWIADQDGMSARSAPVRLDT